MSPQGIRPRRNPGTRATTSRKTSPQTSPRQPASRQPARRQSLPHRPSPRRLAAIIGIAVIAVALLGLVFDATFNFDRIHRGVTLAGIDIGGLKRADAAAVLEEQLDIIIASTPVDLFADEQLRSEGIGEHTVELTGASTTYNTDNEGSGSHSWRISPLTVGASLDGAVMAERAYAVGRGSNFFAGRLKANFFGVELEGSLSYEPTQLATLETLLGDAIGWREENADISFEDGSFIVVRSSEGYGVDHEALLSALDRAFLGTDRSLVVPMTTVPVIISDQEALEVAVLAQDAVAQPVALVYENEDSWNLDTNSLGAWIATSIEGEGEEARLVPHVAEDRLAEGVNAIIGDRNPGIPAQDARFEVVDDQVTIVAGVDGVGVDYHRATADLDAILFPADGPVQDRRIALAVTTLEPALSTARAEEMRITERIASYTTEYTIASGAKVTNIHLAADLLNNSLIEPGGIWSFNDTTGECNAARGFQEATSIVEGEYVDEIGGGICQVATTIFNAVFDSGLPIVERVNHGFYLVAYPAGRDAAVSWRWPDLKFENDTDNWMLLTMGYTGSTVTCTLWGTDPGYTVKSENGDFTDRTDFETKKIDNPELERDKERIKQEGVRGRTIIVTRYVYNSAGELLRKTGFKSVYEPEMEIIEVGTKETTEESGDKEEEKPPEDTPSEDTAQT